jgi:hypothetical protein
MKPVIRTITGFISVRDFKDLDAMIVRLRSMKERFIDAGYEVQTIRITTDILDTSRSIGQVREWGSAIQALNTHDAVTLFHLGSPSGLNWASPEREAEILDLFWNHERAYLTLDAGRLNPSKRVCASAARICQTIASKDPFQCKRFGLFAHVTGSSPFYPASRVLSNSGRFALGLQCANLAVEEAPETADSPEPYGKRLVNRMEAEFSDVQALIPEERMGDFLGFDTSLAPFPTHETSIAHAVELVLGKPFGSSGTLAVAQMMTAAMQQNCIRKTGLCGLMLPVVEDNVLAERGMEGRYRLRELLLYSSVCATGLDAVPIAGNTSVEDLADCYEDLAHLAVKLQKPLSARFFFEPHRRAGDTVRYDWAFACESPVLSV